MKKRNLFFLLILLAGCTPSEMPSGQLNGNYMITNFAEYDSPYLAITIDTLTFCQANTVVQFNSTTHTYREILPDSTCPLLQPFRDSGQCRFTQQNFVIDSIPYELYDSVSPNKFALYFDVLHNGVPAHCSEALQPQ
jgi:hypothetical protein